MNCGQCNTVLPETVAFCGNCGAQATAQKHPGVPQNAAVSELSQVPPPTPQPVTVSLPQESNRANGPQLSMDENSNPVRVSTYFIMMLLFAIPFVNVIMMIIWAIGSKNKSKQNFAIAALIWFILAIILFFISSIALAFLLSLSANMTNGSEQDVLRYMRLWQRMIE